LYDNISTKALELDPEREDFTQWDKQGWLYIKEFDEALRLFLSKFTLPREAQQIDRVMEHFSSRFCKCHPDAFETPDVGYILAFSLIMLNTDAHSPQIKPENKMTKSQFVHNNRGINNGRDLAQEYLEKLYDNISTKALELDPEREDFTQWDKQGWLYIKEFGKTTGSSMNIGKKKLLGKKQWSIISAGCLYVFDSPQDKKPLHIIPLHNLQIDSLVQSEKDKDDSVSGFLLFNPDPHGFIRSAADGKEVNLKEVVIYCEDRKTKYEWMLTFKLNLVSAPSYQKAGGK